MGTHPGDPSRIVADDDTERSLLDVITADPLGQLGPDIAGRWGDRLPFLLKILAAEQPLSIQVHPSTAQAEAGFAREETAGIPRDAPHRNYRDATAKPELLCALSEFHALVGFRPAERTLTLLCTITTPLLAPYIDLLGRRTDDNGIRELFTAWITLPQTEAIPLLAEVLAACARQDEREGEFAAEIRTVAELGARYPGDTGALAALLLNRVTLAPGDAVYLPAGNVHSYLHGTGVEILANSDNVLRCGLTPKHIDVPELLRIVDFSCGEVPVLKGSMGADGVRVYRTEAAEFELSRVDWPAGRTDEVKLQHGTPQILVCTQGSLVVHSVGDGSTLELLPGNSVWLSANESAVTVRPFRDEPTQLFRATAGDRDSIIRSGAAVC